jgi:Leucine Rich repeat
MAHPMTFPNARSTEPTPQADPEWLRYRSRRREGLGRGIIAAVALAVAALLVGAYFLVGAHLVAAWWLQGLHGIVVWDIDQKNWQTGGVTSVSFVSKNSFFDTRINDGDLAHLSKLNRLVSLDLSENDRITDRGLAGLHGLDFLSELNLERLDRYRQHPSRVVSIPLTDACLPHLQALPRLESLILSGNQITDRGLFRIATMTKLKNLDLSATEVTDAGMVHIAGMKSLDRVNLGATRVTKEGIGQLRLARPDLSIEFEIDPAVDEGVKRVRGIVQ